MKLIKRFLDFFKGLFKRNTMRRKISLYIADQLVDLDDQSFILFNYTMEDMTNPVIVRNSFSQSITLKGTPNNNKIFGGIWRSDRETTGGGTSGAYFDPTRKTTFTIYNELNEILESGYCKLDSVSKKRSKVEYKISLYGGLGAFFYALSYDNEGNKRTLADLKFTGENALETELDFPITKDSVLGAWRRLNGDMTESDLWDIINFAPAYNGLPTGLFDASKAMIKAENAGLSVPEGYSTTDGFVLANLPMEYTEWETKDLRSYLQRPVIKMSKIIDAICQSYNNGGYEVELDENFFSSSNPYFNETHLTLPIINSLQVEIKEDSGYITPHTDGRDIYIPNGGDVAGIYTIEISFKPKAVLPEEASGNLYMWNEHTWGDSEENMRTWRQENYIRYYLHAYGADNQVLAEKSVVVGGIGSAVILGWFDSQGVWQGDSVRFSLEANGVSYITIEQEIYGKAIGEGIGDPNPYLLWEDTNSDANTIEVEGYSFTHVPAENKYKYVSSESARSGAIITKKNLLSSDKTPADYLLSFCKMFGLVFEYDKGLKKVSILQKKSFYQDHVIDLTDRVDIGEDIEINPFVFDSKWYNFGVKYEKGEYASYYSNLYDRVFGLHRVNTGYGFNAESKDVMESILFRGAVEVLENSKHFVDLVQGESLIPSIFQDSGGTYTLFKDGDGEEFDLPVPSSFAEKTWLNTDKKTYDIFSKVQFHDAENKGYDERDTLLFFRGIKNLTGVTDRYAVTDDNTWMMALNDNTPCWLLDYQLVDPSCKVDFLPIFSRYKWSNYGVNIIAQSLDFGTPAEVDIPDVIFHVDSSIYAQYWSKYITDRYDNDSKVMTCKVNLSGMQVDASLFQSFYYYDGALWALNKIINHSLTTWDETECEFVKVQDKSNYLN